jgi:nucleoside-diphosphate-sugar epimerase
VIAVTGASGFLGGAVARALLRRGERIRCLQRSAVPELRALGAEVVQVDLGDAAAVLTALRGCDAVLHIAAKAGVWGPLKEYWHANVLGTRNVIKACQELGVAKLVYTSTPSVVHAGGDVEGIDEAAAIPGYFAAPYPATKAIAEREVLAANGPGLATVALRPHLIWGPNDPQLTARVLQRARAGRLRLVGGGTKLIDSLFIDNAVAAHLIALDQLSADAACAGKAYFVTQGEPMPQKALINGMLAAANLPACERSLPPWLAYAAGAVLELAWWLLRRPGEPPMTRFVAEQLATAHWYDISAIRRDLGYAPRVSVAQGLEILRQSLVNSQRNP